MQRLIFVLPLGILLAFAAVPPLAYGNLVTNGGFEDVGGTSPGSPGPLTGWSVGDTPNMFASSFIPHSGTWAAALGSVDSGLGILSQDLSTVTGGLYRLSYWLYSIGDVPNSFSAQWDSNVFPGSVLIDETTATVGNYQQFAFDFVAAGPTTTLEFRATNEFGFWHLDDVVVVELPEPVTGSLILAGALFLGLLAKLKRITARSHV